MKKTVLSISIFLIALTTSFAQVAENAEDVSPIKVGDKIPSVLLTTSDGKQINTLNIIKEKPSIVIFYRGGWCPFCNKHLEAIGQSEEEILSLGYQIIAVSPDAPEKLLQTVDKNGLSYSLYSDSEGKLMSEMGIAFQAPEGYKGMLSEYSDNKNSGLLPVPSLLVIGTNGDILYEYVNVDYRERMTSELLLETLKGLK